MILLLVVIHRTPYPFICLAQSLFVTAVFQRHAVTKRRMQRRINDTVPHTGAAVSAEAGGISEEIPTAFLVGVVAFAGVVSSI